MNEHDDIDDELRRMFADVDDRLDVPVRPDASARIVAGARRRRRRVVVAAAGVFVVAALAGAGVVFAIPERDAPPTASSPPPSGERPEGDPAPGMLIGPDGFGPVRLGMSYDELTATGAIEPGDPRPGAGPDCAAFELAGVTPAGRAHVNADGVQVIRTTEPAHTTDGVSTGWTLDQTRVVYPHVSRQAIAEGNPVRVPVAGNLDAVYAITFARPEDGFVVAEIALQYADQPCIPYY